MEKYPIVLRNFSSKTDGDALLLAKSVYTGLQANIAFYATPVPALTVLSGNIDDYEAALNVVSSIGGPTNVAAKDNYRKVMQYTLRRLAVYVNQVVMTSTTSATAARASLLLSGFEVSVDPTPVGALSAPNNFQAFPTIIARRPQPGMITLRYDRPATLEGRGITTQWEWRLKGTDPDAEWTGMRRTSSSRTKITTDSGLVRGLTYQFRCVQVGSDPTANYSLIVEATVL